jgi:predicted nucleic acid-binding Zn ribbon protein
MATKTARRPKSRTGKQREGRPHEAAEPLPTWRNTRPRGNPEPDEQDLARSRERFEALLGR